LHSQTIDREVSPTLLLTQVDLAGVNPPIEKMDAALGSLKACRCAQQPFASVQPGLWRSWSDPSWIHPVPYTQQQQQVTIHHRVHQTFKTEGNVRGQASGALDE